VDVDSPVSSGLLRENPSLQGVYQPFVPLTPNLLPLFKVSISLCASHPQSIAAVQGVYQPFVPLTPNLLPHLQVSGKIGVHGEDDAASGFRSCLSHPDGICKTKKIGDFCRFGHERAFFF